MNETTDEYQGKVVVEADGVSYVDYLHLVEICAFPNMAEAMVEREKGSLSW